jgi:hypothetical protein
MLCTEAKKHLSFKTTAGVKLPADDMLGSLFLEAMLFCCDKCVPSVLIRRVDSEEMDSEETPYRNLKEDTFICVPDIPNFSNPKEHLQIDEALSYAVINYVAFLINKDTYYRALALEAIADYNANEMSDYDRI